VFYYTDPSGVGWKVKIISDKKLYYTDPSGVGWKVKISSDKIYTCITSHVPVFYNTDPSGVGWALPLFNSQFEVSPYGPFLVELS
jgi:hypothetical protein